MIFTAASFQEQVANTITRARTPQLLLDN